MRFITITLFSIVATLSVRPAGAQTLYTCGDGSIRSVRMITEMVARPPVVVTIDPLGEPQQLVERPPDEPRQAVLVTVQLFNTLYTGEAFTADPENFDPTRIDERRNHFDLREPRSDDPRSKRWHRFPREHRSDRAHQAADRHAVILRDAVVRTFRSAVSGEPEGSHYMLVKNG